MTKLLSRDHSWTVVKILLSLFLAWAGCAADQARDRVRDDATSGDQPTGRSDADNNAETPSTRTA